MGFRNPLSFRGPKLARESRRYLPIFTRMRRRISLCVLMLATMASAQTAVKASMIAPTPGTTLHGPTAMFAWSAGSGAQAYELNLGNSVGASDILRQNAGLDTSLTVKSLPTDCRTVYVRLSTSLNNTWEFNDYTYNACGQQAAVPVAGASNSTSSACGCEDVGSLRHRLEEVSALRAGLEESLKAASAGEPATLEAWASLQNGLRAALPQLSYTSPPTPATIAMFNNYVDPLCGRQNVSAGACLDQVNAAHQAVHDPSCRAGRWSGQQPWTTRAMIEEELQANQAELTYLQSEAGRPSCACASPFALVVQVVTASAISMPGMNESSSRSLNGQQGIFVPVILHPDGTFEGQGSGTDSGNAAAYAAGGYAKSQFGHAQTIQASGVITPGNCSTQPCGPDMMHLVLSGVGGPQAADMQARFPGYSANMSQVTPGGAAVLQFDLPANVGQQAQRVLLDMGMLKSNMSVTIVSGDATGAQQGASLLYSAQQCGQPNARASGVGAPAAVGVVGAGGGGLGGPAPGDNSNTTQNAPQSPPTTPDWVTVTMTPSATTAGSVRVNWSPVDTAQSTTFTATCPTSMPRPTKKS